MFRLLIILILFLIGCESDRPTDSPLQAEASYSLTNVPGVVYGETDIRIISKNGNIIDLQAEGITLFNAQGTETVFIYGAQTKEPYIHLYDPNTGYCKARISCNGIETAGSYKIKGIQVLGPQQPAIADATSPEDMVRKFNLLLEALRVHGIIVRGGTGLVSK